MRHPLFALFALVLLGALGCPDGSVIVDDAGVEDDGGSLPVEDADSGIEDGGVGDGGSEVSDGGAADDGGSIPDSGVEPPADAGVEDGGVGGDGGQDAGGSEPADAGSRTDSGIEDGGVGDGGNAGDGGSVPDSGIEDGGVGGDLVTTVRVHYDSGFGNRIALRGASAGLAWDTNAETTWTPGNVWEWTTTLAEDDVPVELKPVFVHDDDSITWPEGPNWLMRPGATLDIYPTYFAFGGSRETLTVDDRAVEVFLPPSYNELGAAGRAYPVLFMHDGQNLFEPGPFGEWMIDETLADLFGFSVYDPTGDASALVPLGPIEEFIIVAPHNTPDRIYEYTPVNGSYGMCDAMTMTCGGGADDYLDWFEDVVRPAVDASYRTAPGRMGIAGSSLGGLISMHACWTRPEIYERCGVFSPSLWWADGWMLDVVDGDTGPKRDLRLYIDAGSDNDGLPNVYVLDALLRGFPGDLAYERDVDLLCIEGAGHAHNEPAWAARAPWALSWLYRDADRVAPVADPYAPLSACPVD